MALYPWQDIAPETLNNILESVILREGTDYGVEELSLTQKKQRLFNQIRNGVAVIVWSELHESIDIKDKKDFFR